MTFATCEFRRTRLLLLLALLLLALVTAGCAASTADEPEALPNAASAAQDEAVGASCPGLVVRTRADLDGLRDCSEIEGDLEFRGTDIPQLTGADLPKLRRVKGSLIVHSMNRFQTIELPALREVGTEGGAALLQFSFDLETLRRIRLPALERVHGDLIVGVLGALEELRMPKLSRVEGKLGLINLPKLAVIDIPTRVDVGEELKLDHLCHVPQGELAGLADAEVPVEMRAVGCCTADAVECSTSGCSSCDRN